MDTSRTARNGFIESIDWVAPIRITFRSGASSAAAWPGAASSSAAARAARLAIPFLIERRLIGRLPSSRYELGSNGLA